MELHPPNNRGYSLIELLLVVAILSILAVAGVNMIGNRQAAAVRAMLDQLEGAITQAQKEATATSRDVNVDFSGTWSGGNLVIAYGDASLDASATPIMNVAGTILASQPLPVTAYAATVHVPLKFIVNDVIQARAEIVMSTTDTLGADWNTAAGASSSGAQSTVITSVHPFMAGDLLSGVLGGTINSNYFNITTLTPGTMTAQPITISGGSHLFTMPITTTNPSPVFVIEVVGTSLNAGPIPGGPMGLIVLMNNGSSIMKFYNPGVLEGNGQWRRI